MTQARRCQKRGGKERRCQKLSKARGGCQKRAGERAAAAGGASLREWGRVHPVMHPLRHSPPPAPSAYLQVIDRLQLCSLTEHLNSLPPISSCMPPTHPPQAHGRSHTPNARGSAPAPAGAAALQGKDPQQPLPQLQKQGSKPVVTLSSHGGSASSGSGSGGGGGVQGAGAAPPQLLPVRVASPKYCVLRSIDPQAIAEGLEAAGAAMALAGATLLSPACPCALCRRPTACLPYHLPATLLSPACPCALCRRPEER